jgi:hypothetical protein
MHVAGETILMKPFPLSLQKEKYEGFEFLVLGLFYHSGHVQINPLGVKQSCF